MERRRDVIGDWNIMFACHPTTLLVILKLGLRTFYADDLDVISRTIKVVANHFLAIEKDASTVGLHGNVTINQKQQQSQKTRQQPI